MVELRLAKYILFYEDGSVVLYDCKHRPKGSRYTCISLCCPEPKEILLEKK